MHWRDETIFECVFSLFKPKDTWTSSNVLCQLTCNQTTESHARILSHFCMYFPQLLSTFGMFLIYKALPRLFLYYSQQLSVAFKDTILCIRLIWRVSTYSLSLTPNYTSSSNLPQRAVVNQVTSPLGQLTCVTRKLSPDLHNLKRTTRKRSSHCRKLNCPASWRMGLGVPRHRFAWFWSNSYFGQSNEIGIKDRIMAVISQHTAMSLPKNFPAFLHYFLLAQMMMLMITTGVLFRCKFLPESLGDL